MTNKEVKLNEGVNNISFDVLSSSILIYPDSVNAPLVRYSGEFDIKGRGNEVVITEESNSSININSLGNNNIICQNSIIITSALGNKYNFNGATIINGQVISSNGNRKSIELIVPKRTDSMSFFIDSKSGCITIKDLFMLKLIVKAMSGNIELQDINVIFAKLKTMSGNINISILESILNYQTHLKTMNGDTRQKSSETNSPIILEDKYQLEAKSMSGNVNALFKGKRDTINSY